jgi:hypothetical protein
MTKLNDVWTRVGRSMADQVTGSYFEKDEREAFKTMARCIQPNEDVIKVQYDPNMAVPEDRDLIPNRNYRIIDRASQILVQNELGDIMDVIYYFPDASNLKIVPPDFIDNALPTFLKMKSHRKGEIQPTTGVRAEQARGAEFGLFAINLN